VGIFEKSSLLRIARFSLGMFTPEALLSPESGRVEGLFRSVARVSGRRLIPLPLKSSNTGLFHCPEVLPTCLGVDPGAWGTLMPDGVRRAALQIHKLSIATESAGALDCAQSMKQRNGVDALCTHAQIADCRPKGAICRGRETQNAREDAMPHERGFKPVPPSEFFCLLSPMPKVASAARPPATRNPSMSSRLTH
jgi:hypothetical protein